MERVLSLNKPENIPMVDFYGNEKAWAGLSKKIEEYRNASIELPLIIGGEEVRTGNKFKSKNPSDLSTVAEVHKAGPKEIDMAINASLAAKKEWAGLEPKTRILLFKDLEAILTSRREEIVSAAMLECGYTAPESEGGFAEMVDFIRFNPSYYHEILHEKPGDGVGETNYFVQRPLKGFTTAVTPFNFPIAIGYNLPTAMALTGNTVVWKPSSDAVLVSSLLMKAVKDAGIPDGVINMVPCRGSDFGKEAFGHPELTAVNFTGSYETAWRINKDINSKERPHFPRLIMETGGKDFMWVDKSAGPWLDDVAAQMIAGAYGRTGQKCSANSRAYVPREMLGDLIDALNAQLEKFTTGDPTKEKVNMGPVINMGAFCDITSYIATARSDFYCDIVAGGHYNIGRGGYYIDPTVVVTKDKRHKLMKEEIFGPVLTIYGYGPNEETETLAALAENEYKLTGSVYCKDPAKLEKLLPTIVDNAGNAYVNRKTTAALVYQQPFGGDGASGTNRKAGGKDYLREFISTCVVGHRHTPAPTR